MSLDPMGSNPESPRVTNPNLAAPPASKLPQPVQSPPTPRKLAREATKIHADPAVQQAAESILGTDDAAGDLQKSMERHIAADNTQSKEICEQVCKEVEEILNKCTDKKNRFNNILPLLDKFDFDRDQKKRLYAAITGTNKEGLLANRLLKLSLPFQEFTEIYTLQFVDKDGKLVEEDPELKISKAELKAYGDFFNGVFNNELKEKTSRVIQFPEMEKEDFDLIKIFMREEAEVELSDPETWQLMVTLADYFMLPELKQTLPPFPIFKNKMNASAFFEKPGSKEIESKCLQAIESFMNGELKLDINNLETWQGLRVLANRFSIPHLNDVLPQFPTFQSMDEAIAFVKEYELEEMDLSKCGDIITDEQMEQIISLPSLRKIGNAVDLTALFPKLNIIGGEVWKTHVDFAKHGLSVDDVPSVDQSVVIRNLHEMFRTLKVEGDAGITLLTMPKGLTLNKLTAIANSPLQGNPTGFESIYPEIVNEYGDVPLTQTYIVAVTNSVLEESRNLSVSAQQELVDKNGCKMPGLLEMVALNFLTYMRSSTHNKTRLYGNDPWTFSRVGAKVSDISMVVGGFAPAGLIADNTFSDNDRGGVAALRKFKGHW